jgi:hypothetical protein
VSCNLVYEGNKYHIHKSTGRYSLSVNGKELPINGKNDFKKTIVEKLPFIKYKWSYLFNYKAQELLGSINSMRKLKLVTQYYGLDIYESFAKLATTKLTYNEKKIKSLTSTRDKLVGKIELRKKDIASIELPKSSKEDLEASRDSCIAYLDQISLRDKLKIEIANYEEIIDRFNNSIRDEDSTRSEYLKLDEIHKLRLELKSKLDANISSGKSLKSELNKLKSSYKALIESPDSCDKCHSNLKKDEYLALVKSSEDEIKEVETKLGNLLTEYKELKSKLDEPFNQDRYLELRGKLASIEASKKLLEESNYQDKLAKSKRELELLDIPELTKDQITEILNKANLGIDLITKHESLTSELLKLNEELDKVNEDRNYRKNRLKDLIKYLDIVSLEGKVFSSHLESLMESLSSDLVQFKYKDGKLRVYYYSSYDQEYKEYKRCSSGMKVMADLYFITKVNRSSLLVFDEYFRWLDEENLSQVPSMLAGLKDSVSCIVSTNQSNFSFDAEMIEFPVN